MDCVIMYVLALLALQPVVSGVVEGPSTLTFQVNDQDVDESFLVLKVIERRTLHILCMSSPGTVYFKWLKPSDHTFVVYSPNMSIPSIQLQTGGDYECLAAPTTEFAHGETKARSLTIDVLYPPAVPVIEGPDSVVEGGTFNLTCSVESNPPSNYVWSRHTSILDEHILSRGPVYLDPSYYNNQRLFCYAEHNMYPTFGDSVSTITSSFKYVKMATAAVITFLQENVEVYNGDTLDLTCNAHGIPAPILWWTKVGDDQYIYNGQRLIVNNIQTNFTGHYTCWAENTIQPTDSTELLTTVYQTVYISIVDKSIPKECQKIYQNAVLQGCSATNQDKTTLPINLSSSPAPDSNTNQKSCNDTSTIDSKQQSTSNKGLVAACVVGWMCVVCSLVALSVMCIKFRNERPLVPISDLTKPRHDKQFGNTEVDAQNRRVETQRCDADIQPHNERALPTIPTTSASVKSTYHEYLELEPNHEYHNQNFIGLKGNQISFNESDHGDSDMIYNIDNSKANSADNYVDSIDVFNGGYLTPRLSVPKES